MNLELAQRTQDLEMKDKGKIVEKLCCFRRASSQLTKLSLLNLFGSVSSPALSLSFSVTVALFWTQG